MSTSGHPGLPDQARRQRIRSVNIIAAALGVAIIAALVLAAWFFVTEVRVVAITMVVYALLMVPFTIWFRRHLISRIRDSNVD